MVSRVRFFVRFKYLLFTATLFVVGFFVFTSNNNINYINEYNNLIVVQNKPEDILTKFTINTEGCTIQYLDTLDESIKKFVYYPSNKTGCPNSTIPLLGHDAQRIWVRKENLDYFNIDHDYNLLCCYQSFYRPVSIEDITSNNIDHRVKYEDCLHFNDSIAVNDEFVRVQCTYNHEKIYEQYYLFAPKKPFSEHNGVKEISKSKPAYNVIFLGLDAVSRLNLRRTMPKTLKFLKDKGVVEMLGYNKVADNSYPNIMPMLTGLDEFELEKSCHPHNKATFDNCPFIWEWFKQAGYYTALGEDCSNIGTFNYLLTGFSNTPTDYYLHTFIREAEQHVGKDLDFNSYLCMNDKYFYKVLLDYVQNITTTLKDNKLFGYFWEISMSHDYLNYPMMMDDDYFQFFTEMEAKNYLDNTILLLISDHGLRFGEIRTTKQGRIEERLPSLYVLTPPSFREHYKEAYNNLKINSGRLTTSYNIHATLMDLVDLDNVKNDAIMSRSKSVDANDKSISLFLPIPSNRTCGVAGINDHWCTCLKEKSLAKTESTALRAAYALVELINDMFDDSPQCTKLTFSELLDAKEIEIEMQEKDDVQWWQYMLLIKTIPGGALFEATVRTDGANWKLVSRPSRLNLYGNQSWCVNDPWLKLYCYCK